jgi:hypothetical protein
MSFRIFSVRRRVVTSTQVIPGVCDTHNCCRLRLSRLNVNIEEVRGKDTSTTYVKPWNIEILLKLAKVRTKRDQVSHPEYRKRSSAAYSESKTPELKTSFAMTVPKGLDVLSAAKKKCVKGPGLPRNFGICPDHFFRGCLK